MKGIHCVLLLALALTAGSCRHLTPAPAAAPDAAADPAPAAADAVRERAAALQEASARLDRVRDRLDSGLFAEARHELAPLIGTNLFPVEVERLLFEIEQGAIEQNRALAQDQSSARALVEVEERLVLPGSYGRTVVIDANRPLAELPPGPMEELVNTKVDIQLQNAGLRDLVLELMSKLGGLNIIADEALTEDKKLTINLKQVPLRELLSYIARNMGVAFHLGENTVWVTESLEPPGTGPKLETRIYELGHAFIPKLDDEGGDDEGFGKAPPQEEDMELEDVLTTFLEDGPEGAIFRIYKNRNLLVVRNMRENLRLVEELVREFRAAPLQVLIEARFVTISQGALREVGAEINEVKMEKDADVEAPLTSLNAQTLLPFISPDRGELTLSGILGNHEYELVLRALAKTDRSRTLSAPRVTVLNNHSAKIRRGDKIRYYEEYDVATIENEAGIDALAPVPTGSVQELEVGITLTVKANVARDASRVVLALKPEINEFLGYEEFVTAKLPKTNESSLATTVVVESGETVVLGGMLTKSSQEVVKKVPILGDIPLLGLLFRHTSENDDPQHLLIFVTATIVNSSGEFVLVREAATE